MEQFKQIFEIERPHSRLMTLYLLRSMVFPPFSLIALPFLYFRYHTMRYKFDEDEVTMRWGILFRREINLTYRRFQDIHITSGILQRWLGLADIHIQTASGSAQAEMTIEGLLEYEHVRDLLYSQMRGAQGQKPSRSAAPSQQPTQTSAELESGLRDVVAELRAARVALEKLAPASPSATGEASHG